jgi:putative ABC transport system permease protein
LTQVGLYLGFMQNTSTLIDHSDTDLWVTGAGNENFDAAAPMDERTYYRIAGAPGVARAERMILGFAQFRLANGGTQSVEVVGLEESAKLFRPWNVVDGDLRKINERKGIVLDRTEFKKLGIESATERHEINGVKASIVALTNGIRSFTTSPFVFTNLDTARQYTRYRADQLTYVLVKTEPGADILRVKQALNALPHVDAYTRTEFALRSQNYWSTRTGVGTGFFMTAVMGVLVGLVVVGQILYNGTLEHLKEYGTLKAMGAPNHAIVRTIMYQALLSAIVGYILGGLLALAAQQAVEAANLKVVLSPELLSATAVITAVMCTLAATLSVLKVLRLDPASVFK